MVLINSCDQVGYRGISKVSVQVNLGDTADEKTKKAFVEIKDLFRSVLFTGIQ
jgi:hypothetical protein